METKLVNATRNATEAEPHKADADVTEEAAETTEQWKEHFDYDTARKNIDALIGEWADEVRYTENRRNFRYFDVDVKQLQENPDHTKRLAKDETIIAIRTADSNIRREHPHLMRYIVAPTRIGIFKDMNNPEVRHQRLESTFTSKFRHNQWFMPFFMVTDGSQTHGWDSVEIVFDKDKPLHVAVEHIGHARLFFPLKDTQNLQDCKCIIRRYEVKATVLRAWAEDLGFNEDQVEEIITKNSQTSSGTSISKESLDKSYEIHKVWCKYEGEVWIKWYHKDCETWLKDPERLTIGRVLPKEVQVPLTDSLGQPVPDPMNGQQLTQPETTYEPVYETDYNVILLPYYGSENENISSIKGRVFLDTFVQMALSDMWTAMVNGSKRASNNYASADNNTEGDPEILEKLDLVPNVVYSRRIGFFNPPYPPDGLYRAAQALDVKHSEQAGQIASAVSNRVDSRKTATESQLSQEEQNSLEGVQLLLYSAFFANVIRKVYDVASNRAFNGFLFLTDDPTELVVPYEIIPAGDEEVVKRDLELRERKEFLPIVAGLPALAREFLKDTLALVFPTHSAKYNQLIDMGDPLQAVLPVLDALIEAAGSGQPIPPQMLQQAKMMTQQLSAATQTQNPSPDAKSSPAPTN